MLEPEIDFRVSSVFNPVVNQRSRLRGRPLGVNPDAACACARPRNLYYSIAAGYLLSTAFCFRLTVACPRLPAFALSPRSTALDFLAGASALTAAATYSPILPPPDLACQSRSTIDLAATPFSAAPDLVRPAVRLAAPAPPGLPRLRPQNPASQPLELRRTVFGRSTRLSPVARPGQASCSAFSFAAFALRSEDQTLAGLDTVQA